MKVLGKFILLHVEVMNHELKKPPRICHAQTHTWLVVIGLLIQRTVRSQTIVVGLLKEAVGVFAFDGDLLDGRVVQANH